MFPNGPCYFCRGDPRGVIDQRETRLVGMGITVFVGCGMCGPTTKDQAQRIVAARRRVRATSAELRRKALGRMERAR